MLHQNDAQFEKWQSLLALYVVYLLKIHLTNVLSASVALSHSTICPASFNRVVVLLCA